MKNDINQEIKFLDEGKIQSLHKEAFKDTYTAINDFSSRSYEIYSYSHKDKKSKNHYIHEVLCSPPGHGKTTALEYHMKKEIYQTKTKRNPYLLVFNNNDTMNNFYESVNQFSLDHEKRNAIVSITEHNLGQFKSLVENYQVICISQQRFRDLALGFGDVNSFLYYQQEEIYWGKKPTKTEKSWVRRTIIVDEMPEFYNKQIFDIGEKENILNWYDAFAENTNEQQLSASDKNKGRLLINRLITWELNCEGSETQKLIRTISGQPEENDLIRILESLNKNDTENVNILRYQWFMKLLVNDSIGTINRTAKKKYILCSDIIDYRQFGNILILDGTSNHTHTTYERAGFKIKLVHNYHRYIKRLFFSWGKINTSSSKRIDNKSEIREQIANHLIDLRSKGENYLPIPSKGDMNFYINSGAITREQQKQFFMGRQNDNDSLAINLHNVTGKNDLSQYNHIALLNLPIVHPDEYRLQAIGMYGTDVDIRLVKELDDKEEQKLHKNKWFVDDRLQNLFEEQQKAELSQIIHRSSIRKINSDEKVTILLYHNKKQVNELLKEVFNLTDTNFDTMNIQKNNNFKVKCNQWAERLSVPLKNSPNTEYTAFKIGGNQFKKWLENYWKDNEESIRKIFKEHRLTISVKGKGNYKYFKYVDNGIFGDITEEELEEMFS